MKLKNQHVLNALTDFLTTIIELQRFQITPLYIKKLQSQVSNR